MCSYEIQKTFLLQEKRIWISLEIYFNSRKIVIDFKLLEYNSIYSGKRDVRVDNSQGSGNPFATRSSSTNRSPLPFLEKPQTDRTSKFRCRRSTSRIDTSRQGSRQGNGSTGSITKRYRCTEAIPSANGSRTYFTIIVQLPAVSLVRTRRSGPPLYLVQSLRANVSTGGRHKSWFSLGGASA